MKHRARQRLVVSFLVLLGGTVALPSAAPADVSVGISVFHEELSPYGRWVTVGRYGDCWIPRDVAAGWQPYTDGEWVYTEYGWTWVSDDPWGGTPYHYGTWTYERPYGWVWLPGTVWAPAWVTWSYSDEYVGWAPVPPSFGITRSGYAGPTVVAAPTRYVFVPVNRFVGVKVASVRLPMHQNPALFAATRKVTSYRVNRGVLTNVGPPVTRIERAARTRIARRPMTEVKVRPAPLAAGGRGPGRIRVVAGRAPRAAVPKAAGTRSAPERKRDERREAKAARREARPAPGEARAPSRERSSGPEPRAVSAPRKRGNDHASRQKARGKAAAAPPAAAVAARPAPEPVGPPRGRQKNREKPREKPKKPEESEKPDKDPNR